MKKFKVTVTDQMFGELTGEFLAKNARKAGIEAQKFYASELGELPDNIQIKSIERIKITFQTIKQLL